MFVPSKCFALQPVFLLNCTISFEVFLHSILEATHGIIFQANHAVLRDFELWQVVKLKENFFSSTRKTILKQDFEIYDVSISNNATPAEGHTSHPDKWCNCSKVQDIAVSLLSPEGSSRVRVSWQTFLWSRLFLREKKHVLFHRTVPKLRPSQRSSRYVTRVAFLECEMFDSWRIFGGG